MQEEILFPPPPKENQLGEVTLQAAKSLEAILFHVVSLIWEVGLQRRGTFWFP